MTTPTVSIVIPHYGDPAPTSRLVGLLAAQADAVGAEIIVVDDASPSPMPDVPPARVIHQDVNGGFGATVNAGARAASGDLLLILNSDLEPSATFVADLLEHARPWLPAVVAPRIVNTDGSDAWSARRFPTPSQSTVEWLTPLVRWRNRRILHEAVGHDTRACQATSATPTDWLVGAVLLLPRMLFLDAGGFDERFHMNSEEVDLQLRLARQGVPRIYLPEVSVVHEGGGSSDDDARLDWVVTSRLRYFDKWGGKNRFRAGLSAATLVNAAFDGVRRVAGRPVTPVRTARERLRLVWKDIS